MQYFRISEKIADYLMGTLTFRLHGFTVAFDVRVRDVLLNGKALESDGTAPLLVCDGEQFYGKRPVRLRALREFTGGIEGVSVKTYRDCLYLVLNMRKAIADPNIDWDRIQGTQINILIFLADVLRKDGLPVFELSLRRYYRAAAELTNSYYPIWLYETRVRPHLCNADEESFTVADAAEHAVLRHAPIADTHSWLTALTILMVWPICSPNAR